MQRRNKPKNTEISVYFDKFIYTLIILIINLLFGLSTSSFGPTFIDLKHIFNTDLNRITLIVTFLAVGRMIGLFFDVFYFYFNRQLSQIFFLLLIGITNALIAYTTQLWQLYSLIYIYGMCWGAWNNASTVWLREMWQQRGQSVIYLSNFVYGFGTIFGPIIERTFLTGRDLSDWNHEKVFNSTVNVIIDTNTERRDKLNVAFLIIGVLQLIGPILLLMLYFISKYEYTVETDYRDEEEVKKMIRKENSNKRDETPKLLIITLVSIFIAINKLSEVVLTEFSPIYFQYITLELSAKHSAEIVSGMALIFTISRGISCLISSKIKPQNMIGYNLTIIIIGLIAIFTAQKSEMLLWISSLTISYGLSPMFPIILLFVKNNFEINDKIINVFIISSDSLLSAIPFILGTFIEIYPNVLVFCLLINTSVNIILFCLIIYVIVFIPKTYSNAVKYSLIDEEE